MDGPYGAPSSHIFQAQHAVLIATGIGVTPFASILQSIMHRYWKARHTCPKCKFSWASEIPPTVMHLRKAYIHINFYLIINRLILCIERDILFAIRKMKCLFKISILHLIYLFIICINKIFM